MGGSIWGNLLCTLAVGGGSFLLEPGYLCSQWAQAWLSLPCSWSFFLSDQRWPHTWPPATCPVTLLSVYLKPPDGTRPPPVPPEAGPCRQAQWVIQLQTPWYQLFLDLGGDTKTSLGCRIFIREGGEV